MRRRRQLLPVMLPIALIASRGLATIPPGQLTVEVSGMAPQLAPVRQHAARRGWKIVCTGRAGEETVLRMSIPRGENAAQVRGYFDDRHQQQVSAVRYYQPGTPIPRRCDEATDDSQRLHAPGFETRVGGLSFLLFGSAPVVRAVVAVARDCGFRRAEARPVTPADVASLRRGLSPRETVPAGWLVLDAHEDVTRRQGPGLCFDKMKEPVFEKFREAALRKTSR